MRFNVKYILPGDDKNAIISKINFNFQQTFFNGIGDRGPVGIPGPVGIIGQVGLDGVSGVTGERATEWTFSSVRPSESVAESGDIWVNIGPTGAQELWVFENGSWVNSGLSILDDSVWSLLTEIAGPGSSADKNAIVISGTGPSGTTFVLSDANLTSDQINPNLAKWHLSTDAEVSLNPILAFDKNFYNGSSLPSFGWGSTGFNYDSVFSSPDELKISAGLTGIFGSTGGSGFFLTGENNVLIQSGDLLSFTNALGGTADLNIGAATININSSNKILSASSLTYPNLSFYSGITAEARDLYVISANSTFAYGQGLTITIPGTSNYQGNTIARFVNKDGYRVFESRSNNLCVVGQSGPSGSASGFLTKTVQLQNKVSPSATFVRGSFTNNYLPLPLTGTSADVIYINTFWSAPPTPKADGRNNFVYLQLSDFNGIWEGSLLGGRTFDVFLNDDVLCFGGIRTVYPGLSGVSASTVQINALGTGLTAGCRHIRIQFVTEQNIYYQAFTTANPKCGFIPYSLTSISTGPTPTL